MALVYEYWINWHNIWLIYWINRDIALKLCNPFQSRSSGESMKNIESRCLPIMCFSGLFLSFPYPLICFAGIRQMICDDVVTILWYIMTSSKTIIATEAFQSSEFYVLKYFKENRSLQRIKTWFDAVSEKTMFSFF